MREGESGEDEVLFVLKAFFYALLGTPSVLGYRQ